MNIESVPRAERDYRVTLSSDELQTLAAACIEAALTWTGGNSAMGRQDDEPLHTDLLDLAMPAEELVSGVDPLDAARVLVKIHRDLMAAYDSRIIAEG